MQATETRKRVLGEEQPDTLGSMSSLANKYEAMSRKDEAIQLMETAIRLLEKVVGPDLSRPGTERINIGVASLAGG